MKVYVGYDSREDIAWQVCRHSLLRHASQALPVYPIRQNVLRELGIYTRPPDSKAATEFSLTRFLTPYLAAYDGWSVFTDCDFLFTTDIRALAGTLDPAKALYVVKHDYVPKHSIKMDGKPQHAYPRKNWSSFMVFNGAHPAVKRMTPPIVNSVSPSFLHRLEWVSDELIGELPLSWNFLEGEYPRLDDMPNAIHFTNGGPWFEGWRDVDYGELWCAERDLFLQVAKGAVAA